MELPDDVATAAKADTGRTNSPDADVAGADDGGGDATRLDLARWSRCARVRDRSTCSCAPDENSTGRSRWTTSRHRSGRDRCGKRKRLCAEWMCSAAGCRDDRCPLPSTIPIWVSPWRRPAADEEESASSSACCWQLGPSDTKGRCRMSGCCGCSADEESGPANSNGSLTKSYARPSG